MYISLFGSRFNSLFDCDTGVDLCNEPLSRNISMHFLFGQLALAVNDRAAIGLRFRFTAPPLLAIDHEATKRVVDSGWFLTTDVFV